MHTPTSTKDKDGIAVKVAQSELSHCMMLNGHPTEDGSADSGTASEEIDALSCERMMTEHVLGLRPWRIIQTGDY